MLGRAPGQYDHVYFSGPATRPAMLDFISQIAFSVALGLTIILVLYYVLQNFMGSQVSRYVNTCSSHLCRGGFSLFYQTPWKLRLYLLVL